MTDISITIDGRTIECISGMTLLEAADAAEIYIPRLCHHPVLPPASKVTWSEVVYQVDHKIECETSAEKTGDDGHCNLCLVEIEGVPEPVNACLTTVEAGMVVRTDSDAVTRRRKEGLAKILADHPHACLTCAQKQGCSRVDCSSNVPVDERCCKLLGNCELEKVADFIGIPGDTPKYVPKQYPTDKDGPLIERDFNLCIGCLRCVRVCRDVRGADVLGAVWKDDRAWVGTLNGEGLKEAECRFCGACVEVCPTGALMDKEGIATAKQEAPCTSACPLGIDIPRYVRLIALGQDHRALELIRSRTPFPAILGYVCFHPCEDVCRRGELDQPVSICALKRFVAEAEANGDSMPLTKQPDSSKKVAIIGSGPAGLTAGYYLATAGHEVAIFDNSDKPGGMLRHAIPDYRLPPEILDREMEFLGKLGVVFHSNSRIGHDLTVDEVKSRGYDAVLIATGNPISKRFPVDGAELEGVHPGLEFLKSAKLSHEPRLDGSVVIIGGGNVAIDAAMTAVRLGARQVHLVCLEARTEMPAHEWEITQAEEEGVVLHCSWGPKRFTAEVGRVTGVDLVRCTKVFDEQGRFSPHFDGDESEHLAADAVVVTIGQEVDGDLLGDDESVGRGPGGTIIVDENNALGPGGFFAAGDVVRGPSSVVDAMADGRRVAENIDAYLGGSGLPDVQIDTAVADEAVLDSSGEDMQRGRQSATVSAPDERISDFRLIEQTYSAQTARAEADRCLRCHLRQMIRPVVLPPELWLPFNAEAVAAVPPVEGVFQLLDAEKKVLAITGSPDLHQSLSEKLENPGETVFFVFEEDPMFTKRESELIQQYLQEHGELPGGGVGGDDLDDLF